MKVFALNSSREFGDMVAQTLNVKLAQHEERDFEDGEFKIRPLENIRNESIFVIASLFGDQRESVNDKLCKLLFLVGALKDASASRITAVLPYICYARKDRKSKPRDPLTLRYVAQLFEAVGVDHVLTIDVHNLQAYQNAFRCSTDHLEATQLFVNYLVRDFAVNDLVIMSPDIGGIKRAERLLEALNKRLNKTYSLAFLEKYRSSGKVWGETIVGDVKGKNVVIIDDLISSGTTIMRCAEACKKAGASDVISIVTHGLFSSKSEEMLAGDSLKKIVISNTVSSNRLSRAFVEKKVISLDAAPLFSRAIECIDTGESITELLQLQ